MRGPGGEYRCAVIPGHTASGTFVELDPPRRLVFTWGWEPDAERSEPGSAGVVRGRDRARAGSRRTRLRFTHREFPSAEAATGHEKGWDHYLARLVIAAGGGEPGPDPWLAASCDRRRRAHRGSTAAVVHHEYSTREEHRMANPVVHFEVLGKDARALKSFYVDLFGWKTQDHPEMGYSIVEKEEGGIGGGIGEPQDGEPNHVTFYVAVEDLQATLDKAVSLGGKVLMPIMELPMVTLAMFSDPEGHAIGIIKADG